MNFRHLVAAMTVALAATHADAAGATWNAAADFSLNENPNGAWTYGMQVGADGRFTILPFATPGSLEFWQRDLPFPGNYPAAVHNSTRRPVAWGAPGDIIPPDALVLHPGAGAERVVLRWTAPTTSTFAIDALFFGNSTSCGALDSTVGIVMRAGGSVIFTGALAGSGDTEAMTQTIALHCGDALDVIIDNAGSPNCDLCCDHVRTTLTIEDVGTADLTGDGSVGAADLATLLGQWGSCNDCSADFDCSGAVDAVDLSVLLGAWS